MDYRKWIKKEKRKKNFKNILNKILRKMWSDTLGKLGILSLIFSFILLTFFAYLIYTENSTYILYVISGGLGFILMNIGLGLIDDFFKKINSFQPAFNDFPKNLHDKDALHHETLPNDSEDLETFLYSNKNSYFYHDKELEWQYYYIPLSHPNNPIKRYTTKNTTY